MYINLLKKSFRIHSTVRPFKERAIHLYILKVIANFFIPLFMILRIGSDSITLFNFFIGCCALFFIFSGNESFLIYAILFYLLNRILDNCDGGVARLNKKKTFFGKFIDSTSDIVIQVFFNLGICFYFFTINSDQKIFFLGIVSSILMSFDFFIFDKFSSLVRWSNKENNKNFPPYIKIRNFNFFFNLLEDVYFFGLLSFFLVSVLLSNNLLILRIILYIIFYVAIFSFIFNFIRHFYFAHRFLNFRKR
jgi:phosphatidylglycerophosphate synthase